MTVYTPEEVSEILKISVRTIREYLKQGKLKGSKIGTKWRITEEQLKEFLKENGYTLAAKADQYEDLEITRRDLITGGADVQ